LSDPIKAMADRIAELERRLRALETAPRASHTSIRNGSTRWLSTADGDLPNVRIGSTEDTGGDPAFEVTNEDGPFSDIYIGTSAGRGRADFYNPDKTGIVLRYDDGRLRAPQPSCAWQRYIGAAMDAVGASTTTSGTYVDLWYAVLGVGGDQIDGTIDVIPDGGTTGACRVMAQAVGGISISGKVPSATTQQVVEQTGITVSTVMAGPWTIPDTIWNPASDVAGTVVMLTIQALRSAGAGLVHVAPRFPVFGA
jgi:hypothetical protein